MTDKTAGTVPKAPKQQIRAETPAGETPGAIGGDLESQVRPEDLERPFEADLSGGEEEDLNGLTDAERQEAIRRKAERQQQEAERKQLADQRRARQEEEAQRLEQERRHRERMAQANPPTANPPNGADQGDIVVDENTSNETLREELNRVRGQRDDAIADSRGGNDRNTEVFEGLLQFLQSHRNGATGAAGAGGTGGAGGAQSNGGTGATVPATGSRQPATATAVYKGGCPEFRGLTYRIWKLRWAQWMRSASVLSDAQMVTETLKVIRDDHPDKTGIHTLFWSSLTPEQQLNPTIEILRSFLDEQFDTDERQEIFEDFVEWTQMKIRPGEAYHDFITRWTNARLKVSARLPGINIPDIVLVMLLRKGAQLDDATMRSIRAAVKWFNPDQSPNTDVLKQTIAAIKEVCTGQRAKAPPTASVKLVTAAGQTEIQYDGHQLWCDGDAMVTATHMDAQVHIASSANARRRRPKPGEKGKDGKDGKTDGKKNQEGAKQNLMHIKCFSCGEFGHYKTQCPKHVHTTPHNHRTTDGACLITESPVTQAEIDQLAEDIRTGECLNVQENLAFTEEEMRSIREAREAEEEVFEQELKDAEAESDDEDEGNECGGEPLDDMLEDEVFREDPEMECLKPVATSSEKRIGQKGGEENPIEKDRHLSDVPPPTENKSQEAHISVQVQPQESQNCKGAEVPMMERGVRHLTDGIQIPKKWVPWTQAFPFVQRRYEEDPLWVQEGGLWQDPKGRYEGMPQLNERNRWIARGRVDREGNPTPGRDPRQEFTQDWIRDVNVVEKENPEYRKPKSDEEKKLERLDPWGDGRKAQVPKKPESREEAERAEAVRKLNPWGDSQRAETMLIESGIQDGDFVSEARHYAILDTGCTRTVVGLQWLLNYKEDLSPDYRKLMPDTIPNRTLFRYPNSHEEAMATCLIPVQIHGTFFKLRAEIVATSIPLIMGRPTMELIELQLNFKKKWTIVFGVAKKMEQSRAGHPMVKVLPEVEMEVLATCINQVRSIGDENDEIFRSQSYFASNNGSNHQGSSNQEEDGNDGGGDDGNLDGEQDDRVESVEEEENDVETLRRKLGDVEVENTDEEDNGNEKRAASDSLPDQPAEKKRKVHKFPALNEVETKKKKRMRVTSSRPVNNSGTRQPIRKEAKRLRDAIKEEPGSDSDEMNPDDSIFPPPGSRKPSKPMKQKPISRSAKKKSTSSASKKLRGTGQQPMMEDDTLPPGWRREVKRRTRGNSAGRWDVGIWCPATYARGKKRGTGRRFRSKAELKAHFVKVNEQIFKLEDFNFSVTGNQEEIPDDSEEEEIKQEEEEDEVFELPEQDPEELEGVDRSEADTTDPLAVEESDQTGDDEKMDAEPARDETQGSEGAGAPEAEADMELEDRSDTLIIDEPEDGSDAKPADDEVQLGEEANSPGKELDAGKTPEAKVDSERDGTDSDGCHQGIKTITVDYNPYVRLVRSTAATAALIRLTQEYVSSGEDSDVEDGKGYREQGDWSSEEEDGPEKEQDNTIAGVGHSYDARPPMESRSCLVRTPAQTQVSPSVSYDSNANSHHSEDGAQTTVKEDDAGVTVVGADSTVNEEAMTSIEDDGNISPSDATKELRRILAEKNKERIKQGPAAPM